jgi:hypothetical protein
MVLFAPTKHHIIAECDQGGGAFHIRSAFSVHCRLRSVAKRPFVAWFTFIFLCSVLSLLRAVFYCDSSRFESSRVELINQALGSRSFELKRRNAPPQT